MKQQEKSTSEDKQKRQLYACLDKDSGKTFFASYTDQRGPHIDLVSSWTAVRGKTILMLPIPDNWKGGDFTPAQILDSSGVMEANVTRAVGRGQFQVRVLSLAQQDIVEQIHTGHRKDNLVLEQSHIGKIDLIKLTGRVGVESVGRLQSALRTDPCDRRLVLLDVRELVSISSASLGMLHTIVKEEMKNGLYFNFLVKAKSRVESEIAESRILELAPMHDEYEVAVAFLLQSILD